LLEVTALHLFVGTIAPRRRRGWVALSWFLGATHLGLLEDRQSLGLPNTITLLRGNLPALEHRLGLWVPVLGLASDFIDGKLARRTETETLFGLHADFLADAAFWAWFALHAETSRVAKAAVFAAWIAPVALVGALSIFRGRMIDVPRSRWFRPAAAVQVWLGIRMVRRWLRP
jgi:phosphatidylglycerophosphate synthase